MNKSNICKNNILVIYWRVPLLYLIFAYYPLLQYEHLFSIQLSNHNVVIYMITAKAWILIDVKQNRVLRGKALQEQTEIASLTKMYTLYSCLTLNQTLRINPQSTVVKTFQTSITGTSAKILPNKYISLIDLYYGLMLPSGNDVACMLACYYGFWLANAEEMQGQPKQFRKQSIGQRMKYYELYCKKFVQYMNNKLVKQELKHTHTRFQNPHGLSDKNHVSTVSELGEASLRFIKNATFSKICACQSYQGNYYQSEDTFEWANTNILLKEGYTGIKTGNTLAAGGCLSSIIEISLSKYEKIQLLIVLVGSADQNSRFEQTRIIVEEYLKYLKMMKL